jgi:hypothetical protein
MTGNGHFIIGVIGNAQKYYWCYCKLWYKFIVCQVVVEPITSRMTGMAVIDWCDSNFPIFLEVIAILLNIFCPIIPVVQKTGFYSTSYFLPFFILLIMFVHSPVAKCYTMFSLLAALISLIIITRPMRRF